MDSGLPYLDRKKAILIDDTIASGRTSAAAKAVTGIERLAVVYAAPEAINETDICAEVLPFPHLLEWNFWNSWYCPSIYCDIDGLCCPDPPLEVVGDKDRYLKWIEDVLPYDGPRKNPIAGFVTCRPRFAEAHTRRWLDKHGFRYQMLVMADSWITDLHAQAKWKASVLAALSARFYIESSEIMAELLRAELNRRGCLTLVSVPRRSAVYGEFSGWRA
ncbi:MAG: hypothetical protein RML36_15240 [Anaerolineae bacterium]|nr:hypothetical protein [Anaerolineae bacterium]